MAQDRQEALTDALADLRKHAEAYGLDYHAAEKSSYQHYLYERKQVSELVLIHANPRRLEPDARTYLQAVYLDWVNNYLTVEKFAEHNGLTEDQANALISLAGLVFNSPHPES